MDHLQNKKLAKVVVLTILTLGLTVYLIGCKDRVRIDSLLEETINKYYDFEKSENWKQAYLLRCTSFRRIVNEDFYIKQMKSDNAGWTLLSYSMLSATRVGDENYIVKMKFCEQSPSEYMDHNIKPKRITMSQDTHWVKEKGKWCCSEPGSRGHLDLNHQLAYE